MVAVGQKKQKNIESTAESAFVGKAVLSLFRVELVPSFLQFDGQDKERKFK